MRYKEMLSLCIFIFMHYSYLSQPWVYNFGNTSGVANNLNSSTGNTTFLPNTPVGGGTYRVRVGSNGGSIALNNPGTSLGSESELQLNAASGTNTNKFCIYSWANLTSVAYLKAKMRSSSPSNGSFAIFIGTYPTGPTNGSYTSEYAGTLASLWFTYTGGVVSSVTRRSLGVNTFIPSSGIQQDLNQEVEIYCNNANSSTTYFRSGVSHTLGIQTWDLWIDGNKISMDGGWSKASSIVAGVNIGAINFYAESSTGNAGSMYLDDIEYSNSLPIAPTPNIVFSSPSQVGDSNVLQGTSDHLLSQFQVDVSNASTTLNSLTFTTAGSYLSTDVVNFRLYYNSDANSFTGATNIASNFGSVNSGGSITFSNLNTILASGTSGYFFITASISETAMIANTIQVVSNPLFNFSSGITSGSIESGGVQTIQVLAIPDCLGIAGGSSLPGAICDDGDVCTYNDTWTSTCSCLGVFSDADGDATCDAQDECDNDPNKIVAGNCGCGNLEIGQVCDDNNSCTENDVVVSCGVCAGTPCSSGINSAISLGVISQFGVGVQNTQNVNFVAATNTVESIGPGVDVWYSFVAQYNAVRIALMGSTLLEDDNDIGLYNYSSVTGVPLVPLATENDVHPNALGTSSDGGNEILFYSDLIIGNTYLICVRNINNSPGICSLTISYLRGSQADISAFTAGTGVYNNTCQTFKVAFRSSGIGYTVNRFASTDISTTPAWTYVIPGNATSCQLGRILPTNMTGMLVHYYVTVDVTYQLYDAFGNLNLIFAKGNTVSSVGLNSEAGLMVRSTDVCPLFKSPTTGSIATNRSVCGTSVYEWQFTESNAQGLPIGLPNNSPIYGAPGGSRILALSAVPGIAAAKFYNVIIRSKHSDGFSLSSWGGISCIKTTGAAGMVVEEAYSVINHFNDDVEILLYPNPLIGKELNLIVNGVTGDVQVNILDVSGKMVFSRRYFIEESFNDKLIFNKELGTGLYQVEIIKGATRYMSRMSVIR
jgi:hypothetical protein